MTPGNYADDLLAQARAEERERVLALFEALADRWEAMAETVEGYWDAVTLRSHSDHIRRIAEEARDA